MTRKKGNFSTCELCLTATDMLLRCKNKVHREIIEHYRWKHLQKQQAQRDALDKHIQYCQQERGPDGKPLAALVMSDAITKFRGQTPIIKATNMRKYKIDDNKDTAEDRMFGSLLVCGPVKCFILFHCHDFVGGGANCGIEILRLSLLKLAELLAEHNLNVPMQLYLQFDNCGENKNKVMFSYLSLLNEMGIFTKIKVSFLIVGHTHCLIDQWFSSITKIISKAQFLGTPYAVEALLGSDPGPQSTFSVPKKQVHVHAIYDVAAALMPYINKDIKYYQV